MLCLTLYLLPIAEATSIPCNHFEGVLNISPASQKEIGVPQKGCLGGYGVASEYLSEEIGSWEWVSLLNSPFSCGLAPCLHGKKYPKSQLSWYWNETSSLKNPFQKFQNGISCWKNYVSSNPFHPKGFPIDE